MMAAVAGPGVTYSGDPDLDFVTLMIPHHQAAVDMARVMLKAASSPDVLVLSSKMITAQEAEIAAMNAWKARRVPAPGGGAAAVRQGFEASNRKMADAMSADHGHGSDLDRMFLAMMIAHHQGALDMAAVVLRYGTDPEIKASIVASQTHEIGWMKGLLAGDPHQH
jgi:uncharacterized protein (DUF305 family)